MSMSEGDGAQELPTHQDIHNPIGKAVKSTEWILSTTKYCLDHSSLPAQASHRPLESVSRFLVGCTPRLSL